MKQSARLQAEIEDELDELTRTVDELETVVSDVERTLVEGKLGGQSSEEVLAAEASTGTTVTAETVAGGAAPAAGD